MLKHLASCVCVLIWGASAGWAEEWSFHFGQQAGGDTSDSYTYVAAGNNFFVTRGYDGEDVSLMAIVRLGTFDNGGKVQRNLEEGAPLLLDVLRAEDRYERVIERDSYNWQPDPDNQAVMLYFRLAKDDLFAMAEGRALFVQVDSLQFRFGLENAGPTMGALIKVLKDAKG